MVRRTQRALGVAGGGTEAASAAFNCPWPHTAAAGSKSTMTAETTTKTGEDKLRLRRVLVVEDDPVLGIATEETLRDCGVSEVEVCATTDGALEALSRDPPDAVILDVHLADRDDGWAIAELIETLGANRPVIVFSTGTPDAIPPHIAELGSVLEKPYTSNRLIAALREPCRKGLLARLKTALR